ncbi:SpoIIE family protein phosphatase [Verrucomicrobiaceae bacterium N1E253]|uniref:SpoIIE family protein phosphatase n=1 Tax=Oceaniferula marina TaxID=2748318 RepID=A0A851GLS4_9BACT|nr:SpoIIE family protein phosphatase [Oceaniferula marina]NWK56781.1 SpoIIE family protein phosphatase [Oceaniferula marina]
MLLNVIITDAVEFSPMQFCILNTGFAFYMYTHSITYIANVMNTKPRILIVDDERLNIKVLSDLLKSNYKIMAAINGKQALKAARGENPPDLVLLDIMMPEMDGYEVCRQLKADTLTKDIPIMFVTAMGEEEDETKGLALGAVDYITKPVVPAVVEARVRSHVALRRNMLELEDAYKLIESQKTRMQGELDVGHKIQMSMLRQDSPFYPDRKEFSLAATIVPAREVGGDLYDFFFIDPDRLCLCIGDVSGKGVPAALFMAVSKTLIKSRALSDGSPASVMTFVNDSLCEGNEACMFVTLFFAVLNIKTGELVYSNAGHNPPNIKKANGDVILLPERHGMVSGAMEGMVYGESSVTLESGDILVTFTDGVTEAMDPEGNLYSERRLEGLLASEQLVDSVTINAAVFDDVKKFEQGAGQADDITLLSLLYRGYTPTSTDGSFSMTIKNDLSELPGFLDAFELFADEKQLSMAVACNLGVAFDELLTNTISYGYEDGEQREIDITVDIHADHVTVVLCDDAAPFNPFTREDPDTTSSLDEREIGGLGIHLVKKLMDEVGYERKVNQNVLTLTKRI